MLRQRRIPLLIAAALGVGIVALSLLPTQEKFALHTQGVLHPWLHFAAFGLLAALLTVSTRSSKVQVALFLAMLLLSWGTEFAEHLRDGWPVESGDVLADSLGVFAGALTGLVWNRKHRT